MPILDLTQDQMRSALTELEQALYNHERWSEELHANVICGVPPDQRDLDDDAHHKCRFGQWYYGAGL
jgi:diguanylate cyclase